MKLTVFQRNTLNAISATDLVNHFYWTGGTLLSSQYLRHRHSEDLDLFSYELIPEELVLSLVNDIKKKLKLTRIKQTVHMNRQQYKLYKGREILNLEFVYFPFQQLHKPTTHKIFKLRIDSLLDIAVNKIFALYERAEPKDAVDLFFIHESKKWTVVRLINLAIKKFGVEIDPVLLSAQALNAIKRLPMIQPLLTRKTSILTIQQTTNRLFTKTAKKYLSALLV